MSKKIGLILGLAFMFLLSACGAQPTEPANSSPGVGQEGQQQETADKELRTIQYLGTEYTVPANASIIVITGAMEAMEDALLLDVKPAGAISIGGQFPEMFQPITSEAVSIGEKTQPSFETILKLKPDVILGTSKFPAETMDKLNQIATTIPVSHISTDWEANLQLLAELTGKQSKAKELIEAYQAQLQKAQSELGDKLKDKKVLAIRLRSGDINVYPATVFFNPVLYNDLGLTVPAEMTDTKAQQILSLEKFSEIDPDYLFLQYSEDENKDNPKVLEELQRNPIWQSLKAVKNNQVYINVVDPLAQGGTAYSKQMFLQAFLSKLAP